MTNVMAYNLHTTGDYHMKGKPRSISQKRAHAARQQRTRIRNIVNSGGEIPMMRKMHPRTASFIRSIGKNPNDYAIGGNARKIEPMQCFGIKNICPPDVRKEIKRTIGMAGAEIGRRLMILREKGFSDARIDQIVSDTWREDIIQEMLMEANLWDIHCRIQGMLNERNRETYRRGREALGETYTPRVGAAVQNSDDKWDHIILPPMRPMSIEEINEVNKCKKVDE